MKQPVPLPAPCNCRWPTYAVESDSFPVAFDMRMNEYHLQTSPDGHAIIRYCPSCGGKLPESNRDSFFTEPADEEVNELNTLLNSIIGAGDMHRILGVPDDKTSSSTNNPWAFQYTYSSKWRTLELIVHESADGELTFSYGGKYIGA